MRHVVRAIALLLLASLGAAAQDTGSANQRFQRALALHDSGDYAGAIAIYKELLTLDPNNETVRYELTYSTMAKGDAAETIRLATEGSRKPGSTQVRYLELLGSAYDAQNQTKEAIEAYRRGIKIDPKYAPIHFNLGVTLARQSKLKDARESLERAITAEPFYASPQFLIARVYQADGYRVPAMLAYGRFLALERTTERAGVAAKNLYDLLSQGVQGKEGNVQILFDPAAKKDLGDFSTLEMLAAIVVAGSRLKDNPKPQPASEFDGAAEQLASFLTLLVEQSGNFSRGFIGKTYVPFYAALVKAGHAAPFAHASLVPLKLAGTDEWTASHAADMAAFQEWVKTVAPK